MSLHLVLAVAALAASVVLLLSSQSRTFAVIAALASGLEVTMALGLLHLSVAGVPLTIVLGLALAVPGVLAWLRASAKTTVSAAAIVAFVGVVQVLTSLNRL